MTFYVSYHGEREQVNIPYLIKKLIQLSNRIKYSDLQVIGKIALS